MQTELATLEQNAISELRAYRAAARTRRTEHLAAVASALVDARPHFLDKEGGPDWRGKSGAYRDWVGEVYRTAAVPADEVSSLQAAVRYHVGIIIRRRLDSKTLTETGLLAASPLDRARSYRERVSSETRLLTAQSHLATAEDAAKALELCTVLLRRFDVPELAPIASEARASFIDTLHTVAALTADRVQALTKSA